MYFFQSGRFLYLDEYQAAKNKVILAKGALIISIIVLLGLIVYDYVVGEPLKLEGEAPVDPGVQPSAGSSSSDSRGETKIDQDKENDKDR